jgi:hypothetical protein
MKAVAINEYGDNDVAPYTESTSAVRPHQPSGSITSTSAYEMQRQSSERRDWADTVEKLSGSATALGPEAFS